MKKSELKKLIKEAAKDLNLYDKPTYVGRLSEEQLKLIHEQDGVAAGGGIYGNQIVNGILYQTNKCYTPVLRQCSIDTEGNIFSLGSFDSNIPSTQYPDLGTYIPTCRHYPNACVVKKPVNANMNDGSWTIQYNQTGNNFQTEKIYQIGECFTWDSDTKIECVVGFADLVGDVIYRLNYTNEAEGSDGQYDVNNNGVPDHLDCSGANWTGTTIYGCTDDGNMGQAWWIQGDSNITNESYQTITGFQDYPTGAVLNYDPEATDDDGSCEYPETVPILGCMDPMALNYDPNATEDDGSCEYPISGCTDNGVFPNSLGQNPTQFWLENGYDEIYGIGTSGFITGLFVQEPGAENYNPEATIDDGSCEYIPGCTVPFADNYNPDATIDDDSCVAYTDDPPVYGCMDPLAINYNPDATAISPMDYAEQCQYSGCMDPNANNFDDDAFYDENEFESEAAQNEALCEYPLEGCTDPNASNYNPEAEVDDGSCIFPIPGCPYEAADNYNPEATIINPEHPCIFNIPVCTNEEAENFVSDDVFGLLTGGEYNAYSNNLAQAEAIGVLSVVNAISEWQENNNLSQFDILQDLLDIEGLTVEAEQGTALNIIRYVIVSDNSLCIIPEPILGCMDVAADNYNGLATEDDGSCE